MSADKQRIADQKATKLAMTDAELAAFMGMTLEEYEKLGEDIRTGKVKLDTSWIE